MSGSRLTRWFGHAVRSALLLVIAAWLLGQVVSDRWWWSQWLLWIPTLAVLPCLLTGMLTRVSRTSRRWVSWLVGLVIVTTYFAVVQNRFHRSASVEGSGMRVVHWAMSHGRGMDENRAHVQAIINLDGDITVLSHAGGFKNATSIREHFELDDVPPRIGHFVVISRYPIIELRELAAADGIFVAMAELDTTARLGHSLVVFMIDLPSDPSIARMELAHRAKRILDSLDAPAPDVLLGDFNLTRGSAALRLMTSGMHHAFDAAGHGYAASYHREWPVYHIDHLFTGERVRSVGYRLVDPGMGRHRTQVVEITSAGSRVRSN